MHPSDIGFSSNSHWVCPKTVNKLRLRVLLFYKIVRYGSWLCENAKTLNRDRRSYSSKTVSVAQRASGFNLEIELKNIILRRVSIFEFLHSQGHVWTTPALQEDVPLAVGCKSCVRPVCAAP
jgi:hypothetical protein